MKKQIQVRQVKIGGGAPVAVQSMLNVHTEDVEACLAQINRLEDEIQRGLKELEGMV